MPAEKYDRKFLKEQLPILIREQLREDNHSPSYLPSYEYLNTNGFNTRGLNNALQRHFDEDLTLDQHLRNLGFGYGGNDRWPCTDQETVEQLDKFIKSREERHGDRDPTLQTVESALRTVLRTSKDLHGMDNLLTFARYDTEKERQANNEKILEILDRINEEKNGGEKNYFRYFEDFYDTAHIHTSIDYNPVETVEDEYSFDTNSDSDPQPLEPEQIKALWEVILDLPNRYNDPEYDLTPAVKNIINRHGIEIWRVYMMVLILLGVGVGPRSKEYIRMDCRNDWVFDGNPRVKFEKRKNTPGEVPILAFPEFLHAFRDFMEDYFDDWNGKPFPSSQSKSGSRIKGTLNNWLKSLCKEANVRLEDGEEPTLQNLRQTWHDSYKRALRVNEVQIAIVADEAGTKNKKFVKEDYASDEEQAKSIREIASELDEEEKQMTRGFARREIEGELSLPELPKIMKRGIDQNEYLKRQSKLDDFL